MLEFQQEKADKKQINKTILNSTRKTKLDKMTEGGGSSARGSGQIRLYRVRSVGWEAHPSGRTPRPGEEFGFYLKRMIGP